MIPRTDSSKVRKQHKLESGQSRTFPPLVCSEMTPVNSGPTAAPAERGRSGRGGEDGWGRGGEDGWGRGGEDGWRGGVDGWGRGGQKIGEQERRKEGRNLGGMGSEEGGGGKGRRRGGVEGGGTGST